MVTSDFNLPLLKWISDNFYISFIPVFYIVIPTSAFAKTDKSRTLSAVIAVATVYLKYCKPDIKSYLSSAVTLVIIFNYSDNFLN